MRVLVVGATGQVGSAAVRSLLRQGHEVRALVRDGSAVKFPGAVATIRGDLRDVASLQRACAEVDALIATANSLIPRGSDSFEAVEGRGYTDLIRVAREQCVGHFVFLSVPPTRFDRQAPGFAFKHAAEESLRQSGLKHTIVQPSLFMDSWLPLIGCGLAMRCAENPTLERPWWFSRFFIRLVGGLVESRGLALVPGNGRVRHAFIAVADVAEFLTRALQAPGAANATWQIGGPERLDWYQVMEILSDVLGRRVRMLNAPEFVFALQSVLWRPFSSAAANIMTLNRIVAAIDTAFDADAIAGELGIRRTSLREFIAAKAALSAPAPLAVGT